jgi:hypothetical protein
MGVSCVSVTFCVRLLCLTLVGTGILASHDFDLVFISWVKQASYLGSARICVYPIQPRDLNRVDV